MNFLSNLNAMQNLFKNEKLQKLIEYLRNEIQGTYFEGHVYLVGGVVRDAFLGKASKDVDIVVDIPNGGVGFANFIAFKNGCHVSNKNPVIFPTYGTAKFQLLNSPEFSDIEIECVHTRKEQYHSDSRNPSTAFGTIEDDAMRRDLTINSLYYNISTSEIHDYCGFGLSDLKNHIIRTPSNPNTIFSDDPLRILRTIRFATRFNWGVEEDTWMGMIQSAQRILSVAQERVTDEINKILVTDKPSVGIRRMLNCNKLLEYVMPGIAYQAHVYQSMAPKVTLLEHTLQVLDKIEPTLEYRLAALYHDIGKIVTYKKNFAFHATVGSELTGRLMKIMKYPNKTISNVSTAISLHEVFSGYRLKEYPSKKMLRKFKSLSGESYDLTLALIDANNKCQCDKSKTNQIDYVRKKIAELEEKEKNNLSKIKLPINGKDIMQVFSIKSGPIIGRLLKKIKDAYFEDPTITREKCLELISEQIKKTV